MAEILSIRNSNIINTSIVNFDKKNNIEVKVKAVALNELDDFDDNDQHPTGERWDPLGAANEDVVADTSGNSIHKFKLTGSDETDRIRNLEEEQEMLSSSLLALTSHFAQVQLRLRQIVNAPIDERDQLLENLNEFAFRGIPAEMQRLHIFDHPNDNANDHLIDAVERHRANQYDVIEQLKLKLMEVEKFAYESGAKVLPQSVLLEKQRVIIDEFKNKINLKVNDDDLPQLSHEDLRHHVDSALGELVGPIKMKDTLLGQLKTQISDLERFVAYLQLETYDLKQMTQTMASFKNTEAAYCRTYNTKVAKITNRRNETVMLKHQQEQHQHQRVTKNCLTKPTLPDSRTRYNQTSKMRTNPATVDPRNPSIDPNENLTKKAATLLDKASSILNMFAMTQFGCGGNNTNVSSNTTKGGGGKNGDGTNSNQNRISSNSRRHQINFSGGNDEGTATAKYLNDNRQRNVGFCRNTLKQTEEGNHWGDLRAQLEVDIQEIVSLVAILQQQPNSSIESSDDNDNDKNDGNNEEHLISIGKSKQHEQISSTNAINNKRTLRIVSKKLDNHTMHIEITRMVRKHFAVTLQKLIEHGLRESNFNYKASHLIVPFRGCFDNRFRYQRRPSVINHHATFSNISSRIKSSSTNKTRITSSKNKNSIRRTNITTTTTPSTTVNHSRSNRYKRLHHDSDPWSDHYHQLIATSEQNDTLNHIEATGSMATATFTVINQNYSIEDDQFNSDKDEDVVHVFDGKDYNDEVEAKIDMDDDDLNYTINPAGSHMHVWELILEYYHIKNGDQFNETPARKLSQSFNLDIAGTSTASNKQSFLSIIGTIINVHAPYKRSYNSHFKAFVSHGLNTKKLTHWLNLIFQCTELIEQCYTDWSYVVHTGFRDALKSIDRLSHYNFQLPADIAVRQFQNINDVFM